MRKYEHSGHPLHGRPTLRRETGLIEVTCPHGIGHPIVESIAWMDEHGPAGANGSWDMHGCDGCCAPESSERTEREEKSR